MIYLGQPYRHADPEVMRFRAEMGAAMAAVLMEMGEVVFAPIPHSVAVSALLGPDYANSHLFWMAQDLPHLAHCQALYVLCLDGWSSSEGLSGEVDFAKEWGIPILHLTPNGALYQAALSRVQQKAAA